MKYKKDQKVYYKIENVPAMIKGFSDGKVFITYFPKGSEKRLNKLVKPSDLSELKKPARIENPNYFYFEVGRFHSAFCHPKSNTPTPMSADMALRRMSWDLEESIEMLHASSDSIEQFTDLYDKLVIEGYQAFLKLLKTQIPEEEYKLTAQVDAIGDKLYFNQGDFNVLGVKPYGVFKAIQAANMRKLHDGMPKFREGDGKIIKPDGWFGPEKEIKEEIERQQSRVRK